MKLGMVYTTYGAFGGGFNYHCFDHVNLFMIVCSLMLSGLAHTESLTAAQAGPRACVLLAFTFFQEL